MTDQFRNQARSLSSPAMDAAEISPNDNQDLTYVTRGIYVGGSGSVSVVMASGQTVTFQALAAGGVYPLRIARVRATGTTASNLVALW